MQATSQPEEADQNFAPPGSGPGGRSSSVQPRRALAGALAGALDRVGDRWSLLVVDALGGGPRRFNDLQDEIPGIATNVLSQRLRRLEADGIVLGVPYSRRPLRYAYELTAAGRALGGAAQFLAQWNSDLDASGERTQSHYLCGTPMEVRWYCPTCDRVGDRDARAGDDPGDNGDVVWL